MRILVLALLAGLATQAPTAPRVPGLASVAEMLSTPGIHPLDADLQLPERSFSYELQRRLVKAAIQGPFREATSRILDCTGLTIHNHNLEPPLTEAAADFDGFYQQRTADPSQPSASLLVVCRGL